MLQTVRYIVIIEKQGQAQWLTPVSLSWEAELGGLLESQVFETSLGKKGKTCLYKIMKNK